MSEVVPILSFLYIYQVLPDFIYQDGFIEVNDIFEKETILGTAADIC